MNCPHCLSSATKEQQKKTTLGCRTFRSSVCRRAFNERGACELTAVVTTRARPGVVVSPSVWWNKLSPDGVNINQLTSQALTDMGGGATFYDALVEVERLGA